MSYRAPFFVMAAFTAALFAVLVIDHLRLEAMLDQRLRTQLAAEQSLAATQHAYQDLLNRIGPPPKRPGLPGAIGGAPPN